MSNFSWVEIYKKIAEVIKEKHTDELIDILKDCESCKIDYLKKKSNSNELINVDLFTFFGSFNRGGFESRRKILQHISTKLDLCEYKLPLDFDGIPVMENRNSFFYWAEDETKSGDLNKLNSLFAVAIGYQKNNQMSHINHYH